MPDEERRAESATGSPAAPADLSFEAALLELQETVRCLEDGSLGLDEAIACFERGVALLRGCYQTLEKAERRIELLTGFDRGGNPLAEPFDAAATIDGSGPSARRRRKADPAAVSDAAEPSAPRPSRPVAPESPAVPVENREPKPEAGASGQEGDSRMRHLF
jgi:exodeoxyribonuclease VII small subunit